MRCWWILLLLALTACADPRERRMRESVEFAESQLHQAQIEPLAGNRLRQSMETSGTPIDYIERGVPADSTLGPFRWQQPQQAFDVVVSGQPGDWRIDGYGENLETPLASVQLRR